MSKVDIQVVPQSCPLCLGAESKIERNINLDTLVSLYLEGLKINVGLYFEGHQALNLRRCAKCDLYYFDPLIVGDSDFYRQLKDLGWYYSRSKQEFSFAAKNIKDGELVLDVGCGDGNFFSYLPSVQYIGLELNDSAVAEAHSRGLKVFAETIEEWAQENPGTADVVCAFQVLEHVMNPRSFLDSCIKCLRSGGRLIISVPSADSFLPYSINNLLNLPPHHVSWWSDQSLKYIGELFNLEFIDQYNDLLADEHLEAYLNTLVVRALDIKKNKIGLLDNSMYFRVYAKIASFLVPLLKRGLEICRMRPRGHSSTVIFVKSNI